MAQQKLKEKRKLKRFIIQVQVSDTESNFAYTENLHTEGMVLISEKIIAVGKEFHLELVHIRDDGERLTIPLRVRCMWNRPKDYKTLYNAGFKFINLAPKQAQDIESLIGELTVD